MQDLKIFGKTTQDGEPSPENPIPLVSVGNDGNVEVLVTGKNLLDISKMPQQSTNGITFSLENGGIKISGTATANTDSPTFTFRLPAGTYVSNMNKIRFPWLLSVSYTVEKKDGSYLWLNALQAFTVLDEDIGKYFYFRIERGQTVNEIIYPQLEVGSTATPYEPYKSQPITIPTPEALHGIPVSSGGNYTDSTGQQWICDSIERNADGGWEVVRRITASEILKSSEHSAYGDNGYHHFTAFIDETAILQGCESKCNYFKTKYTYRVDDTYFYLSNASCMFFSNKWDTLESFNQWLQEKKDENNPVEVIGILETPIDTPITDPDLIAKLNALHTYYGITNLFCTDNAGQKMQYLADTKLYIDNKLAPMTQAMIGGI